MASMGKDEKPDARAITEPLRFVSLCWPEMMLYDKQREILLSVRDNVETFVHAANELGKTRIAAIAAVWFFASRTPARVVTSSSSESQLKSILWSEIVHLIQTSQLWLPFRVTTLHVENLKTADGGETEARDYIIGHVTNIVESFQGHHLPNDKPRVLAIFDEASGIPNEFYDAAGSWAHRMLVIGNPLSTTNFFYAKCRVGDVPDPAGGPHLLRKVIHVSGDDSPNVRVAREWKAAGESGEPPVLIPGLLSRADYLRREHEWDEVPKTTRLYGKFYVGDQARLFPDDWLDVAMDSNRWEVLAKRNRQAVALGVDVAGGGRDKTCWTLIDRYGVIEQILLDTPNTMEVPGRTVALIRQYGLSSSRVAVDAGGLGKGVVDRLWEMNYRVQAINFGETAGRVDDAGLKTDDVDARKSFKNRRAEMYGRLREFLRPTGDDESFLLPPDAVALRRELSAFPLMYDSEGKLVLPPKEPRAAGQLSLRQLLGASPDRSDSLVLALHALKIGRPPKKREPWGGVVNVSPGAFRLGMGQWQHGPRFRLHPR